MGGLTPDSDLYPSLTYIDPLLMPPYIITNDHSSLWNQAQGDWLLSAFITRLDKEICDDIPEFKDHREFVSQLFDAVRTHGWAVVQFYEPAAESPDQPKFRVFTPLHMKKWITQEDPETNKKQRIGLEVHYTDDLGNNFDDEIYFNQTSTKTPTEPIAEPQTEEESQKGYLVIWEKGNGISITGAPADSSFAVGDLNVATASLAIQTRQVMAAMVFSATNPYFLHVIYGENISPDQRRELQMNMAGLSPSKGFGAKRNTVEEIIPIENGAVEKTVVALDQTVQFFCATTGLPLSFYLGEKKTGGLGDTGEVEDDVRIDKKKQLILQHFLPYLKVIFQQELGVTISDLDQFYTQRAEEKQAQAQQDQLALKGNTNGQETQKND